MTGKKIFQRAMSLMVDNDTADYEPYALDQLNIMMAETFDVNNGLRMWHKKEPLAEPPEMGKLEHECPYETQLVAAAFPYGLASKLLFDDGDLNKVALLQNQYAGFVADCIKGGRGVRTDVYGGVSGADD